jgi:cold shock CspA family protein
MTCKAPPYGVGTKVKGRLLHWKEDRGFGFIRATDQNWNGHGADVFVHFTDMQEQISVGDPVEFVLDKNEKGWRAAQVKRV